MLPQPSILRPTKANGSSDFGTATYFWTGNGHSFAEMDDDRNAQIAVIRRWGDEWVEATEVV